MPVILVYVIYHVVMVVQTLIDRAGEYLKVEVHVMVGILLQLCLLMVM